MNPRNVTSIGDPDSDRTRLLRQQHHDAASVALSPFQCQLVIAKGTCYTTEPTEIDRNRPEPTNIGLFACKA